MIDTHQTEAQIRSELRHQTREPLLPVEKQLIGWSLGVGVVLLIALYFVNTLFSAGA